MARRRPPRRPERPPGPPLRSHVRADGSPKVRYGSEQEAREAAQLQWVLNSAELGCYRCEICSGWHLARSDVG
jgi:hypothetical protein